MTHVIVLGAGSVGLAMAASLRQSGARVTLAVRGRADDLRGRDIRIDGVLGEHSVPAGDIDIAAIDELAAQKFAPDYIVVATKTFQVGPAARSLGPALKAWNRMPGFLLLQNGWGSADEAAAALPEGAALYSAAVLTGFARRSATEAVISVHGAPVRIGALFGHERAALEPLLACLRGGFIDVEYRDDIRSVILSKVLYNVCLNALGALLRCPYGELTATAERQDMMVRLADEAVGVIRARYGLSLYEDGADYVHGTLIPKLIPPTATHKSSMYQDLQAGRKTEIDYLNGKIALMADEAGVPAPSNALMASSIRLAEMEGLAWRQPIDGIWPALKTGTGRMFDS